ncbi:hypothetical protein ABH920_001937, partial [Catenulispora sp. EB89]
MTVPPGASSRRSQHPRNRKRLTAGIAAAATALIVATPAPASAGTTPGPSESTSSSTSSSTTSTTAPSSPSKTQGSTTPPKKPSKPTKDSAAPPAAADASTTAQETGTATEVTALTTETQKIVANPDGTFTATTDSSPVRVKKSGAWTPIDATLVTNADGSLSPKASLGQVTFSPGGTGPAVTLGSADGSKTVSVSLPETLPAPQVSGDVALYPNVLPGVDLRLAANGVSYTEVLVVHDAKAAADPGLSDLSMHMHATGVSLSLDSDENLQGTDAGGNAVFSAPQPIMWDSHPDQHAGPTPTADDPGSGFVTKLPTSLTAAAPTGAATKAASNTLTSDDTI